jgi:oligopeptide transport system substrate-binding protein
MLRADGQGSFARRLPRSAALAWLVVGVGCGHGDGDYFGTTSRSGKDPATFYTNNGAEPEYLDPGKSHDSASSALAIQLFEGLTTYDPRDLHPRQAGAIAWDESADHRIFRFHLRPEARWSDGKPVTAHDYEYSWKRVLRPSFASLSASNLYALKNAEGYNLGRLRATTEDVVLREGPDASSPAVRALPKGTAVDVIVTSPKMLASTVAPLAAAPEGVARVDYAKADPKRGQPEKLTFGGARADVGPAPDGGWSGREVRILRAGPAVECNHVADRWLEIASGDRRGWVPGCMLSDTKSPAVDALVAEHRDLPTFDPDAPRPADGEPALGFVPTKALASDDRVVGVRATDDHTLEVELERPTPWFTDLTSSVTLCPVRKDVVEPFEAKGTPDLWTRPENIVTNGPYTLDSWKFRYEITMKASPTYYDYEKLRLKRAVFLEVEDYHATMNLYKAGDIDTIGDNASLPSEYLGVLAPKKDFRRGYYLSTYWYELNTKVPPVDDVRVRRALNLAVDKRQLVDKVTRGGQIPATHYVPDFTGLGYSEQVAADKKAGTDPFDTPDTVFDPERARALLKEAGYEVVKDGDGYRAKGFPSLEVLYNTSEGHRQIAVTLQDMWKRHLGISVTLRNEEWKVMLKNVRDGKFQVVRFGWVAEYNHANTWLDTFLSYSPNNRTGWADPRFDALLKRAASEPDPKESIRLYRRAEKLAVDGMAKIPLYFYTKSTLVKPWVKGFYGHGRDMHLLRWLWIDADWKAHAADEPAYVSPDFAPPGRLGREAQPAAATASDVDGGAP